MACTFPRKHICGILLSTHCVLSFLLSKSRLPSVERKQALGVWLTNSPSPLYYDQANIKQAVDELKEAGFSVLYPNVWSRGTTFHASEFAPLEPALKPLE